MTYGPARVLGETVSRTVTWKQYGAVGDGVTDDTAAINACMAAANANGWTVHASSPDVGYLITGPVQIYDGTVLRGESRAFTKVICQRTHAIDCVDSADDIAGHTADWQISDLLFVGDDDVATDGADHVGLNVRRAIRFRVDRCEFRGFTYCAVFDGRKNTAGDAFGVADGRIADSIFQVDATAQQVNPTNAYPKYLVEFRAEDNGVGGADAVSFYNCRIYGEILTDGTAFAGDGATETFSFGPIVAGRVLTDQDHMVVEYVPTQGGGRSQLTAGVDYSIDFATDPNDPEVDFAGGSAPLGAPVKSVLLSGGGDGVTKNFRLSARPSFPASDGGRAVRATVSAVVQAGGVDYGIVDGNRKDFDFQTGAVSAGDDTISLTSDQMADLTEANDIGGGGVGRIVRLSSTGALPAGLSAATDYFVTAIVGTTLKLAASYADAVAGTPTVVDITDAGTGVHTLAVQHAIELAAAPASGILDVDDVNLRFRWIDPNVDACVKMSRGAQRIGFFSCGFGGARYGVDFDHARRCVIADAYFQIHEYGVRFGPDADENTLLGFAARTDATIIYDFAVDETAAGTNSFDAVIGSGAVMRNSFSVKESLTEDDGDAARIRKNNGQLQLDALAATGSVRIGVSGNSMMVFNGSADRISLHNVAGAEQFRLEGGNITPRAGTGAQSVGADILSVTDGVTAPASGATAQIYVDTADGALKVRFGSGTVKQLASDP